MANSLASSEIEHLQKRIAEKAPIGLGVFIGEIGAELTHLRRTLPTTLAIGSDRILLTKNTLRFKTSELLSVALVEISVCSFPAYIETEVHVREKICSEVLAELNRRRVRIQQLMGGEPAMRIILIGALLILGIGCAKPAPTPATPTPAQMPAKTPAQPPAQYCDEAIQTYLDSLPPAEREKIARFQMDMRRRACMEQLFLDEGHNSE